MQTSAPREKSHRYTLSRRSIQITSAGCEFTDNGARIGTLVSKGFVSPSPEESGKVFEIRG
jgi:hypothetical protein